VESTGYHHFMSRSRSKMPVRTVEFTKVIYVIWLSAKNGDCLLVACDWVVPVMSRSTH
jgi:hypothetical protein